LRGCPFGVSCYAALGVAIREVLTDNGPCYQSRDFEQARRDLGLIHRCARPYTPRTNGKAERFIQTALGSGLMPAHIETLTSAPRSSRDGCTPTTGTDLT
jgi:transposase InsO family protein